MQRRFWVSALMPLRSEPSRGRMNPCLTDYVTSFWFWRRTPNRVAVISAKMLKPSSGILRGVAARSRCSRVSFDLKQSPQYNLPELETVPVIFLHPFLYTYFTLLIRGPGVPLGAAAHGIPRKHAFFFGKKG